MPNNQQKSVADGATLFLYGLALGPLMVFFNQLLLQLKQLWRQIYLANIWIDQPLGCFWQLSQLILH